MKRLQHCLAAVLLASASTVPAAPLDFLSAYEAALQHDPQRRAALAERDASREHAVLGRAHLLPSVSASYSNHLNHADITDTSTVTSVRHYRSISASLQLRQPLYHPEGWAARRQGEALAAAGEAQFAAREQELVIRLFEAFAGVLVAQEQVSLAGSQLATLRVQQLANQRLLASGEGTRTDWLETAAKLQMTQAQWLESNDALAQQRARLHAMTGISAPEVTTLLPERSPTPSPEHDLEHWQRAAERQNPVLQNLRLQVEAATEAVRRAGSGHQPRLDLVASSGRSESDTVSTYRQSHQIRSLGLQLNIPLYGGGAVSAQERQAMARQSQLQAQLDTVAAEVQQEVARQYRTFLSSAQRIVALEQAEASSRLLVEATEKSVQGGIRTNLDVLNARDQLVAVRKDLTQTRLEQLLAGLRLRLAAGTLSEEHVRAVAGQFEPRTP